MKTLAVATKNKGKMREIAELLSDVSINVISMEEAGFARDISEDGETFADNALIKAREVFRETGIPVMADDSGLEVDFLNGAPGIYSSRFAGEGATDEDRTKKLLEMLKNVPYDRRSAKFVCVVAVIDEDSNEFTVRGECHGYIAGKPQGENGFGYDPVFYLPQFGCTMAQLEPGDKNRISHRGKALRLMKERLMENGIIHI